MTRFLHLFLGPSTLARFLRFLVVGFANTLFGYAVYAALVLVGTAPGLALAIAWIIGVVWNYVTHGRLVFDQRGMDRLPAYVLTYAAIFAINWLALQGLLTTGAHPLLAQAILLPLVAVLTFLFVGRALTGAFPRVGMR